MENQRERRKKSTHTHTHYTYICLICSVYAEKQSNMTPMILQLQVNVKKMVEFWKSFIRFPSSLFAIVSKSHNNLFKLYTDWLWLQQQHQHTQKNAIYENNCFVCIRWLYGFRSFSPYLWLVFFFGKFSFAPQSHENILLFFVLIKSHYIEVCLGFFSCAISA